MKNYIFSLGIAFFLLFSLLMQNRAHAQIDQLDQDPTITRYAKPGVPVDTLNLWSGRGLRDRTITDVSRGGRILVPRGTTLPQLITLLGGNVPGGGAGPINYYVKPQVDIYLLRFDEELQQEVALNFRYRSREPFPEPFRNYVLQNNEYVYIVYRQRGFWFEYITAGLSIITSVLGIWFFYDRVLK
jgi:hypothetical protein